MSSDLGVDSVIDARCGFIEGEQLLGADLIARLREEPGGLYYDASYGAGIGFWLNEDVTPAVLSRLSATVEEHCRRDPRVRAVRCTSTHNETTDGIALRIRVEAAEGSFDLVFWLNDVVAAPVSVPSARTPVEWAGWELVWPGVFDDSFDDSFE